MANDPKDETYSEEEAVARREAALKRMLNMPPKPRMPAKAKRFHIPSGVYDLSDFDLMRFRAPQ